MLILSCLGIFRDEEISHMQPGVGSRLLPAIFSPESGEEREKWVVGVEMRKNSYRSVAN